MDKEQTPKTRMYDDYGKAVDALTDLQDSMNALNEYLKDKIWIGAADERRKVKYNIDKIKDILDSMYEIHLV